MLKAEAPAPTALYPHGNYPPLLPHPHKKHVCFSAVLLVHAQGLSHLDLACDAITSQKQILQGIYDILNTICILLS